MRINVCRAAGYAFVPDKSLCSYRAIWGCAARKAQTLVWQNPSACSDLMIKLLIQQQVQMHKHSRWQSSRRCIVPINGDWTLTCNLMQYNAMQCNAVRGTGVLPWVWNLVVFGPPVVAQPLLFASTDCASWRISPAASWLLAAALQPRLGHWQQLSLHHSALALLQDWQQPEGLQCLEQHWP